MIKIAELAVEIDEINLGAANDKALYFSDSPSSDRPQSGKTGALYLILRCSRQVFTFAGFAPVTDEPIYLDENPFKP